MRPCSVAVVDIGGKDKAQIVKDAIQPPPTAQTPRSFILVVFQLSCRIWQNAGRDFLAGAPDSEFLAARPQLK
jgi:hypothetical protein